MQTDTGQKMEMSHRDDNLSCADRKLTFSRNHMIAEDLPYQHSSQGEVSYSGVAQGL